MKEKGKSENFYLHTQYFSLLKAIFLNNFDISCPA